MPEGKQKLTLSVDSAVVDRAKELGVNISEMTEQVLRGYAFDPKDLDSKGVRAKYLALLLTMDPLVTKYRTHVKVGELLTVDDNVDNALEGPIEYYGNGMFSTDWMDDLVPLEKLETNEYFVSFLKPSEILKNFVNAIEQAKLQKKEEVGSLVLASRIIQALTEAETGASPTQPSISKKRARPQRGPRGRR